MKASDLRVQDLLDLNDAGGVIRFAGNRVLLLDAVALGLLRKQLVELFGVQVARGFLTRLGYTHGWRVAESLKDSLAWDDEREWRVAGGRLHRLQGLVTFEPVTEQRQDTLAEAVWRDSFEAEQHVLHLGLSTEPVCWSLVGFASGYLSYVFGETIYAVEETCCGAGDHICSMVAKTETQWGPEIEEHKVYYEKECLDASLRALRSTFIELENKLKIQQQTIDTNTNLLDTVGIVARSDGMRRVVELCKRVAPVDSSVLIVGESGVGKERVARLIHERSARSEQVFIGVNCGALAESLLESELFGHAKGAFSGATKDRMGLFEAAHGGTILLDEIGDISSALQVRLLRVVQERKVRRVGENLERDIDVRILAATHRNLDEEVAAGRFRQDLLYRLRVVNIQIPPLRTRPDDIIPLARLCLLQTAKRYKRNISGFTPDAAKKLISYRWPGNVRELQNVMERAVVFAEAELVQVWDLQLDEPPPVVVKDISKPEGTLKEIERRHILATLKDVDGNRAEAARRLGIGSATLFRKLKQYSQEEDLL